MFHANSIVVNNGEDTAVHVTGKARLPRPTALWLLLCLAVQPVASRWSFCRRLPLDELRDEFRAHWQSYVDRPIAGRNVIVGSFCPQVRIMG